MKEKKKKNQIRSTVQLVVLIVLIFHRQRICVDFVCSRGFISISSIVVITADLEWDWQPRLVLVDMVTPRPQTRLIRTFIQY